MVISDSVKQYYSCGAREIVSVFHFRTTYRMPLISSSRDGGCSCGVGCHEQHLTLKDLMASAQIVVRVIFEGGDVVKRRPWTGRARSSGLCLPASILVTLSFTTFKSAFVLWEGISTIACWISTDGLKIFLIDVISLSSSFQLDV